MQKKIVAIYFLPFLKMTNVCKLYQYKTGQGSAFAKKYKCDKLVYFDETDDIIVAIDYEKKIKAGSRKKKIQLREEQNPYWLDLAQDWFDI